MALYGSTVTIIHKEAAVTIHADPYYFNQTCAFLILPRSVAERLRREGFGQVTLSRGRSKTSPVI